MGVGQSVGQTSERDPATSIAGADPSLGHSHSRSGATDRRQLVGVQCSILFVPERRRGDPGNVRGQSGHSAATTRGWSSPTA